METEGYTRRLTCFLRASRQNARFRHVFSSTAVALMQKHVSFKDARRLVLRALPEQPAEHVELSCAQDRVLARDVHSPEDIPAFDNSKMDGFAVRANDTGAPPTRLRVVEELPAGRAPETVLEPGTCAEIMTGAPLPGGADAVVPVEKSKRIGDGHVELQEAASEGMNVRRAAMDIEEGEHLFEAGACVTPPMLGLLAMLGIEQVPVSTKPQAAIVATGDELVGFEEAPGPGEIRDANSPTLAAQARSAGAVPEPCLRISDDEASLRDAVRAALEADLILMAGGMSAGRYDYVRPVLREMGMEWSFWRVRQRPGRPFGFGFLQETPVLGLPGNPTTASVCFEIHARPALRQMAGLDPAAATRLPATLQAPVQKPAGLHHFARGVTTFDEEGRLKARVQGPQSSGFYAPMAQANSLIHLPEEMEDPPAGTSVEVEWLSWARPNA
jgi:molybdopterin molybdotransferase